MKINKKVYLTLSNNVTVSVISKIETKTKTSLSINLRTNLSKKITLKGLII